MYLFEHSVLKTVVWAEGDPSHGWDPLSDPWLLGPRIKVHPWEVPGWKGAGQGSLRPGLSPLPHSG